MARIDFKTKKRARMSVWEAIELLDTLVDESDPDVSVVTAFGAFPTDAYFLDKLISDGTSFANR
jgi:hypothetical protein